jgi:hypothetical protein
MLRHVKSRGKRTIYLRIELDVYSLGGHRNAKDQQWVSVRRRRRSAGSGSESLLQ